MLAKPLRLYKDGWYKALLVLCLLCCALGTPTPTGTTTGTADPSNTNTLSQTGTTSPTATDTVVPTETLTPMPTTTATLSPTPSITSENTFSATRTATTTGTPTVSETSSSDGVLPPLALDNTTTVNVTVDPLTVNVTANEALHVGVRAIRPSTTFDIRGVVAFLPTDDLTQRPFYVYLKFCTFGAVTDGPYDVATWDCLYTPPNDILSGTTYRVRWIDLYLQPDLRVIRPAAALPDVNVTIVTDVLVYQPVSANFTDFTDYSHYWSFLVSGENGSMYWLSSDDSTNGTWSQLDSPVKGDPMRGFLGLCFLDKYDVMLVGGKNYRNGQYGSGFIVHGNTTHFDVVFEGGPAMTSVACKGLGSPGIRFVAAGRSNALLVSEDGTTWVNVTKPVWTNPPMDFWGVSCSSELLCVAMGRVEMGLYWETHFLQTEDGGYTWTYVATIKRERGVSLSCVAGSSTCYATTEIYTGSKIHRSDDYGVTWVAMSRWDVLSEVKIHCYWADECIAGAGSWLGRWDFPSEIRQTKDGGITWDTLLVGEIGDFFGGCSCGALNNEICICTVNNAMWVYNQPAESWYNITFPSAIGPMAEFQSYFAADVLRELYRSTSGASWNNNQGWLTGNPCHDKWYGVECLGTDGASTDVYALRLAGNGLNGTLPPTLGTFTNVVVMEMHLNLLRGSIPSSFGRLSQVVRLSLFNNFLTGTLTRKIGFCTSLELLALFNNEMSGALPSALGDATLLRWLYLYNNQFSGQIPDLSRLSRLSWLNIRNNELTGTLPDEISKLTQLHALDLSKNFITGTVPRSWGALTSLAFFSVESNRLIGNTRLPSAPTYDEILHPTVPVPPVPSAPAVLRRAEFVQSRALDEL